MGVLHRLGDIAHRRALGQHHVDIDAEPLGMEAARIGDPVRAVEEIARRLRVEHHAPVGLDAGLRADQQVLDVLVLDPPAADLDLDRGDLAGETRARAADPHPRDGRPGELLGALDGVPHGVGRGRHVGDIAALDALRGAMAAAEHDHLAPFGDPGDHRRDAERADVHRAEHAGDAGLEGTHVPAAWAGAAGWVRQVGQRK